MAGEHVLYHFVSGLVPGFDPVGSLLKSLWLKEPRPQQKQGTRPGSGFAQSPDRSLREPAGQYQARQRAIAAPKVGAHLLSKHQSKQAETSSKCVYDCVFLLLARELSCFGGDLHGAESDVQVQTHHLQAAINSICNGFYS